jgi:hypothetical protein
MATEKIDETFISYASDILADTNQGLTGTQIVKYCNIYAVDFGVKIPITSPDFGKFGSIVPNKRTALYKNLREFNGQQQFVIIKELCELTQFESNSSVQELKKRLIERFSRFSLSPLYLEKYQPTGWERVDRALEEMKLRLDTADNEEKFQAIGMIGRETLITVNSGFKMYQLWRSKMYHPEFLFLVCHVRKPTLKTETVALDVYNHTVMQ